MFGSKEASEDKLKKMVEKGKWDKLRKQYLDSDKTTQVALAKACAASRNDGSVNILTSLLEVDDVDVKTAAVTSLGEVGDDHVTALIRQLAVKTPAESSDHKSAGEDCRKSIRAGSVKKRKGEEVSVKRSSFVFLLQGISESAPADCFCPNRNLTKS
jgi:hypothetical protein